MSASCFDNLSESMLLFIIIYSWKILPLVEDSYCSYCEVPPMLSHHKDVSEKALINQLRELPPVAREEVLTFIEFMQAKHGVFRSHRGIKGLWAEEEIAISDDDISEARRECWGSFPREDIL